MSCRKSLLTFREDNGAVLSEMLGIGEEFAELVDPDDGSVRHTGPFVMHGREWQIESVAVTGDLIRITCAAAPASVRERGRASSHSVRRTSA